MSALRRRLLLAVFAMLLDDQAALAQCPTATLTPNVPQTISCNPTVFSLVPTPGHWNAVAVGSNANWNLTLLPAISFWTGAWVDFAVSNGHLGSPAITSGLVDCLTTPIQPAKVLHCTAAALTVNSPTAVTIAANASIQIVEFEVQTFGNYYVDAIGSAALRWAVYAPSSNANWQPRDAFIADGIVGNGAVIALFPGWHALVLTHEGFPTLGPYVVDVSITCGTQPVPMAQNGTVSVSQPCQYFHAAPGQGVWNVIGITSASNWDLTVLGVTSSIGGSMCDAVVANGHLGYVPGGPSNFSRQSGTTGASAVHAVNTTPLTLGAATQSTWSTSTVMQVFELQVTQPGGYTISVTGPASLGWDLYLPGASSAWRPRSTAVAGGSVPSTLSNYALAPGWHAIVVRKDGGVGVSGSIAVTVTQNANPVPTIATLNPSKVPAGGYGFTLHVLGSGFAASSVVRLGGQPLPTMWVNAGNLDAQVPASMIAQPANAAVEVFTPAPGGGTATAALSIALPKITGISPSSIPAPLPPSTGVNVFVIGEMFGGFSDVYANGVLLSSNYAPMNPPAGMLVFGVSPYSIPQAQAGGAIAITVVNYGFQSNSFELVIGSGGNAGTIVTDPPAPAPGATFSIRVDGGIPGQPLTVVASLPPASPWTLAGTPFVIGLDPASLIPVVDGLGIFGAADPAVLGAPPPFTPATYPGGVFVLPGITMPAPAAGIDLVLQAVYGAPSSPTGFSLTWARWPLSL